MQTRKLNQKLAILGCGKMGAILLQGFFKQGLISADEVVATVQHADKCKTLSNQLGIPFATNNREAVQNADIVLICVKPQVAPQLLEEISGTVRSNQLLISIVASVPIQYIRQRLLGDIAVIRAMPNTPALVGAGMTAITASPLVQPHHMEIAKLLFESVGRVVAVDEKHMDAVTGLSASGPAFAFIILESLAEAGVKVGLPRDLATTLAAQMLFGSAQLVLETGHHPALLKDAVTTPAGCTIDGIIELEKGRLRVTLINAVVKATQRARQLIAGSETGN